MLLNKPITTSAIMSQGDSSKVLQIYTNVSSGNVGDTGILIAAEFDAINATGSSTQTIAIKAVGDIQLAAGNLRFPDGSSVNSASNLVPQWSPTVTYNQYSIVAYQGSIYSSVVNNNVNQNPSSSPSYWVLATATSASTANTNYNLSWVNGLFDTGSATGWNLYSDSIAPSPIDGTGGAVSNLTFSINSTNPLVGAYDAKLVLGAFNEEGEGLSYDFTADNAALYQPTYLSFYYTTSAYYASGDITLWIYDKTNGILISPSTQSIPAAATTTAQQFTAYFNPNSNSTSYRLIFHIATTNASGYTLEIDQVYVGRIQQFIGNSISAWTAFTPTYNTGAPGTNTTKCAWRRVGSNMEISYTLNQTGAGTAGSGNYLISLPTVYTMDTTNLILDNGSGFNGTVFGHGQIEIVNNVGKLSVMAYSSTQLIFSHLYSYSPLNTSYTGYWASGGFSFGTSAMNAQFTCSVPISQWTTNINLVTDFTEYASNTDATAANDSTHFVNGSQGAAGIIGVTNTAGTAYYKTIQFIKPMQATDLKVIELYNPSSSTWSASDLNFDNTGNLVIGTRYIPYGASGIPGGMCLQEISSTQIRVWFFGYPFGYSGTTWANAAFSGVKWRVRKTSQGNFAEQVKQINATGDNLRSGTSLVVSSASNTAGVWSAAVTMPNVPAGAKVAWCTVYAYSTTTLTACFEAATGYTLSDITVGNNAFRYNTLSIVNTNNVTPWMTVRIPLDSNGQFKWCAATNNISISIGYPLVWEY